MTFPLLPAGVVSAAHPSQAFPPRRSSGRPGPARWTRLLPASALLLALAGCAAPSPSMPIGEAPTSLIDTYWMVRGMALGYVRSGRAGPAEVTQLIGYDHAAVLAVVTAELDPTKAKRAAARERLAALIGFVDARDLDGMPAPDSPLAAALRRRSAAGG